MRRELLRHTLSTVPHWQDRAKAERYLQELNEKAYGIQAQNDDQELDAAALAALPQFG